MSDWLIDAADLLAEPDPGPTPMLVEDLIVDGALVACVGKWKTTKSYGLLDICVSIATGRPAFGIYDVPQPGPVVFVNEESGRAALWRRLDALCRGRAIPPEELRGQLHVAANARIRLDDADWQARLIELGRILEPRLFVFDPLARMKGATRDENAQKELGPVIEFLRALREETGGAVAFVQHTGHQGEHMRGTSDLESIWESRLRWKRDGQTVTIDVEHREAEAPLPVEYRIAYDSETRSMRFNAESARPTVTTYDLVLQHLAEHRDQRTEEIARALEIRTADVRRALEYGTTHGTTHAGPSGRRDKAGRPIRDKVWNLAPQEGLWPVPNDGTTQDEPRNGHRGSVARPVSIGDGRPDEPPDEPSSLDEYVPTLADDDFLTDLARAREATA